MYASIEPYGNTAVIHLAGDLDYDAVPLLRSLLARAGDGTARRVILEMSELNCISVAGVRCLVFSSQSMPPELDLMVLGAQPKVERMLRLAAFTRTATLLEAAE